jgi:uncharacterized protein
MPRAVFDTVVFVRALINPLGIWGRLNFQHGHAYALIISPPVVEEILEVLHRPELTSRFRSLAGLDLARVIEILDQAEAVELQDVPAVSRDPKDDKFLATAVAARADYLVTEDDDLLVLGAHHGIPIVTASQFLAIVQ